MVFLLGWAGNGNASRCLQEWHSTIPVVEDVFRLQECLEITAMRRIACRKAPSSSILKDDAASENGNGNSANVRSNGNGSSSSCLREWS